MYTNLFQLFERYTSKSQRLSVYQKINQQDLLLLLYIFEYSKYDQKEVENIRENLSQYNLLDKNNLSVFNCGKTLIVDENSLVMPNFNKTLVQLKNLGYVTYDNANYILTEQGITLLQYLKEFSSQSRFLNCMLRGKLLFIKYPYSFSIIIVILPTIIEGIFNHLRSLMLF